MAYSPASAHNALPTPPHSPRSLEPVHGTVVLLDSLTAFYQQERYWIHHTRAALEVAIAKGSDSRALAYPTATSPAESSASSSASSEYAPSPSASVTDEPPVLPVSSTPIVKSEPDVVPHDQLQLQLQQQDALAVKRSTRWNRRKNMMKLKIDGIAPHSRPHRRPHRAPPTEPGARLLEMFSELVDARMESCQRVSRLVRDAHRPDLSLAMI